MNFFLTKKGVLLVVCIVILSAFNKTLFAQTCPSSQNQSQWPTHSNWFFGQAQMMNFGATGTGAPSVSTKVGPGSPYPAYESCASASDEDGNLVIYTNGVKLWNGNGEEVHVGPTSGASQRLKAGAENPTGNTGSAVQGVLITKHPLNDNDYYIFTTDDAIGGINGITYGFNYSIYSKADDTCSAPQRIGAFRATEQVSATFHKNGLDIWVVTHEAIIDAATKNYHSYLLECSGLNTTPVVSDVGFNVRSRTQFTNWAGNLVNASEFSNERGAIEFQQNPTLETTIKAAATFHCGQGTWDPVKSISLLDFNTETGEFSNNQGLGDGSVAQSNPYDCEFSLDGTKLYVSYMADPWSGPLLGRIGEFDVGTGTYTEIGNTGSDAITIGTVKLGGDGTLYAAQFNSTSWAYQDDLISSNGATLNTSGMAAGTGSVGYGLPNMFVPPQDWVEIQDPGALTDCDLPVDLQTDWLCKGTSAENTSGYENAYSVATSGANACTGCSIDPITGVFDAPGPGTYKVYFEICTIKDSLTFTVGTCGCDADISSSEPICVGETFLLDTAVISSSGVGVWTIDSIPSTPGVSAVIDDSGADTLFDASAPNTKYGFYKLKFTVDNSCEDSMYMEVKKIPTVVVDQIGPFCDDSVAVVMTAIPANGGDVTGVWQIDNGIPFIVPNFDPVALGPGNYTVKYGVDSMGCLSADSIDVLVKERPSPSIDVIGPFCADEPAVSLTITPLSADSGTWSGDVSLPSTFDPSTLTTGQKEVIYTIPGLCGAADTINVTINPLNDASINTPQNKDSLSFCVLDPNPTLTVNQSGGTWNNAAVNQTGTDIEIDLASLGVVVDEMLIYTIPNPCEDKDTIWVTTTSQLDATITSVGPFCDTDSPVILSVVDAGGTFSGNGVDPTTGEFDPAGAAALGSSPHTITYTIPGNCGDVKTIDIVVNSTPDPSITNLDFSFCENHGDVALTTIEPGGTWVEITNTNGGLNSSGSLFTTASLSGQFELEYGFSGQCPAFDTITFEVIDMPTITFPFQDTLCEDDASVLVSVNVVPPSSILTWTGDGDALGNFDPSGKIGDNDINLSADNQGCITANSLKIHVLERADATLLPVANVCVSEAPFSIGTVSGVTDGTWLGTGITDANNGIFDPSVAGAGTFEIRHTISGKCGDWDTVLVTVEGTPDPTITPPSTVCAGSNQFTLTAATAGGTWGGDVSASGTFTPTTGGSYTATYTLTNPCQADDAISFDVHEVPATSLSVTPRTGCAPLNVVVTDESAETPVQSSWDFGNSNTSTDVSGTVNQTYSSFGCFDIKLVNVYANGCVDSTTLSGAVCTYEIPTADFSWLPQILDVDNNVAVFKNQSSQDVFSFEWDFSNVVLPSQSNPVTTASPQTSIDENPTVVFNSSNGDTVNVKLKVTNSNGCSDSIVKPVIIRDKFSVFLPNAFTPNDDGTNDTFFPVGRNLEFGSNYDFRIYNRWGTLIWMSKTPYQGWDGRVTEMSPSGGKIAQVDVYVWRLVVVDPFTGQEHELVGTVTLMM